MSELSLVFWAPSSLTPFVFQTSASLSTLIEGESVSVKPQCVSAVSGVLSNVSC